MNTGYIQEYILKNGQNMTNKEMAINLGLGNMKMAGNITAVKNKGLVPKKGWLKSDILKSKYKPVRANFLKGKFKTIYSDCKKKARNFIVNQVLKKKGKILSLCGERMIIEQMIYDKKPRGYSFDMVEYNKKLMKRILRKSADLSIFNNINSFYCGEILDLIKKANKDEYAHLILDYCGTIDRFHRDVQTAILKNIVQVGGSISITFCKRCKISNFIRFWANNGNTETHSINFNAIDNFINFLISNGNYKIIEIYNYSQKGKNGYNNGSKMVLYILERIK